MTKREIILYNKHIGKFMGKNFKDPLNYLYHKSWDKLMTAVEKIEKNYAVVTIKPSIHDVTGQFYCFGCRIDEGMNGRMSDISIGYFKEISWSDEKIDCVFICVGVFCKWYNENKK